MEAINKSLADVFNPLLKPICEYMSDMKARLVSVDVWGLYDGVSHIITLSAWCIAHSESC